MKMKNIIAILTMSIVTCQIVAQPITTNRILIGDGFSEHDFYHFDNECYFDDEWDIITSKSNAEFYRKKGYYLGSSVIVDYFAKSNQIQNVITSYGTEELPDCGGNTFENMTGWSIWYNENGEMTEKAQYYHGIKLNETWYKDNKVKGHVGWFGEAFESKTVILYNQKSGKWWAICGPLDDQGYLNGVCKIISTSDLNIFFDSKKVKYHDFMLGTLRKGQPDGDFTFVKVGSDGSQTYHNNEIPSYKIPKVSQGFRKDLDLNELIQKN